MIIYKAINLINNKLYIGQTTNKFKYRVSQHIYDGEKRPETSKLYFSKIINKYGKDNFKWEILEECNSKYELDLAEEWYIRYYKSYKKEFGYNKSLAKGFIGLKHTDRTKNKMSKNQLGNKNTMYGVCGKDAPSSRKYIVTLPSGNEIFVYSLKPFSKKHKLNNGHLNETARGNRNHHKNFKARYYDESKDINILKWNKKDILK